jgi:peptidoglycan-associated lipoprotein
LQPFQTTTVDSFTLFKPICRPAGMPHEPGGQPGALMQFLRIIPVWILIVFATGLSAQSAPADAGHALARSELTLGYTYLHANAPPGVCGCFGLNGGFGSASLRVAGGLSVVADFSGARIGSVPGAAGGTTIFNYLLGPRYSLRRSGRLAPYGQILLGGSTESRNSGASASGFAFSGGGGLNARLSRHVGWNAVEIDWLRSQIANGGNNRQNDLRIDTGAIFRF